MEKINLAVQDRKETGRKIRESAGSKIPAVVYGHGFETKNVWVGATSFNRAFDKAGTNTMVSLEIDDAKPVNVLIHDFQAHPITNQIMHIDFFHVRMDETVDTSIPIVVTGESEAVKSLGGTLTHIESIAVRALPGDLIHEITVDISVLGGFDDRIVVADLDVSDKIEILIDEQTSVASVIAPRTQEEVDAADEEVDADVSAVESTTDKEDTDKEAESEDEPKKD